MKGGRDKNGAEEMEQATRSLTEESAVTKVLKGKNGLHLINVHISLLESSLPAQILI